MEEVQGSSCERFYLRSGHQEAGINLAEEVLQGEEQIQAIRLALSRLATACGMKQCSRSVRDNSFSGTKILKGIAESPRPVDKAWHIGRFPKCGSHLHLARLAYLSLTPKSISTRT